MTTRRAITNHHRHRYGLAHRQARRVLLAGHPSCYWCGKPDATVADHDPPLSTVREGEVWHGVYRASCVDCSLRQAQSLMGIKAKMRRGVPVPSRPW